LPSREPRAVIFGCAGPALSSEERALFRDADPVGFILFRRNCESPDQVRALVRELRASVERADAPVLIDQEGGRVARLQPPHWRAYPAPATLAALGGESAPDRR
jgi:beta-N-acetylhexosaminidase